MRCGGGGGVPEGRGGSRLERAGRGGSETGRGGSATGLGGTAALGSLQPMIESGKLRALAVTSPKRWPDLPNLPTFEEQGIHNAENDTFQGIFAPAGVPQDIIDRMVKEITAILQRPDVRDRYAKSGLPVTAEPPEAFRARIARELPMYKDVVDKAGLKIQ